MKNYLRLPKEARILDTTFVKDIITRQEFLKKHYRLPVAERASTVIDSFSVTAKTIFYTLVALFITSGLYMAYQVNAAYMVEVPINGGTLTEGIVGLPRFINPILSVTDAGKDITTIVYSGLMKKSPEGELTPDLAESYTVSEDGKTYTFTLRNNIFFHDGTPVTTDDIEYTIQKAQDPALKSPLRALWQGISIQKTDALHITFTLQQPYAEFLENTTVGILPKHIWSNVMGDEFTFSAYNENAIGSGPYKIDSIKHNAGGIPTSYTLKAFSDYVGDKPLITTLILKFYANEEKLLDAYNAGEVESVGSLSPESAYYLAKNGARVEHSVLPRVFGIFFNQDKQPLFIHSEVKEALNEALDRKQIIDEVFFGYAEPITDPLPHDNGHVSTTTAKTADQRMAAARTILEDAGWVRGEDGIYTKTSTKGTERLSFSLTTGETPELKKVAELALQQWVKLGAEVIVKIFEAGDLNQNVIRPRTYDALLFGQIVNKSTDLYAFWHSSQRNDPGLNIALYTNSTVDDILESLRTTTDKEAIAKKYQTLTKELEKDVPAVFIYSPHFLYVVPERLKGLSVGTIRDPADRFIGIEKEYVETDGLWKLFLNTK